MPVDELKEATFSGVRWVAFARLAGEGLALVGAVALARMIPPAEFGRAAVALAFVPLAVILTFEGCASALVQRRSMTPSHVQGAVTLSLVAGLGLTLLGFTVGATLARAAFGARTGELIELISPVFVLASIGAVPRALLWRELNFRRVSVIEVFGLLAGATTAVTLAAGGLDGEALIFGALVNVGAASALLFLSSPFALRRTDARSMRDIASFGLPAAGAGLVHVGFNNANYLIVATRLSAAQAGLYWRGFQLGVAYQEKASGIMMRLAFPIYSRTKDQDELRSLHQRATRLQAVTIFPLLGLLIFAAPVLVPLVFGPAWEGAVLPSQILAGAGMVAAILVGYPQVMLAVGKPKALLRFNIGMLSLYIVSSILSAPFGITVVCLTVVGMHLAILVGVYGLLLRPYAGVPMKRLVLDVGPATLACAAEVAVGFPLAEWLQSTGVPDLLELALLAAVGSAVYLTIIRSVFPAAWSDVLLLTRKLVPVRVGRWFRKPGDDAARMPALSSGAP